MAVVHRNRFHQSLAHAHWIAYCCINPELAAYQQVSLKIYQEESNRDFYIALYGSVESIPIKHRAKCGITGEV